MNQKKPLLKSPFLKYFVSVMRQVANAPRESQFYLTSLIRYSLCHAHAETLQTLINVTIINIINTILINFF